MEVVTELTPRLGGFRVRCSHSTLPKGGHEAAAARAGVRGGVRWGRAQAEVSAPRQAQPAWGWATHPGRPAAPLRRRAAGPAWPRSAPTASAAERSALRPRPLAAAAPEASQTS